MASASSAACQATSMTNKLRQQWAAKQQMRERAASLDTAHLLEHLPPSHLPSEAGAGLGVGQDALAPLGRKPGDLPLQGKPSWHVTTAIMDRFSGLSGRRRNPSGDSTTSEGSEAAALAELPGRRRHFSESSVLSGDVSMDSILVSNT